MLNQDNQYRLITLLLQVANSVNKNRNIHLRKNHLTSRQADVLRYVNAHPNCTITDIAVARGCVHQTIQQIIKKMVKKRLLVTRKSPRDGRYQIINISAGGRRLNQVLRRNGNLTCQELLRGMNNENQKALLELLIQGHNNLKV